LVLLGFPDREPERQINTGLRTRSWPPCHLDPHDAVFAPQIERIEAMKRLITTLTASALALSLVGATAASAQPYRHGGGYHGGWHDRGWHGRGNDGALIGLGVGLFALGAIAAASSHDRYYDRYEYGPPPPPPPPPAYYGRYGYGY
jgi:hypothetical protein